MDRWEARYVDAGPGNERDHAYVFQDHTVGQASPDVAVIRPAAESGTDTRGRITHGAGIDLGEAVWNALGMTDNGPVSWELV